MKYRVLSLALIGATSAQIIRQSLVDDIKATTTSWFPVDDVRDNMFYGMTDLEVKGERSTYTLSRRIPFLLNPKQTSPCTAYTMVRVHTRC